MKVAFIFGKGIDGCGVTRGALIFEKWLLKEGFETLVVDIQNGQYMVRASMSKFIGPVLTVDSEDTDVSDEVVKKVNDCDIAIFHSYPTRKVWAYGERFLRFVQKIEKPIKVMHDHGVSTLTINSVPQSGEIFSYADILVPQSSNGLSQEAYLQYDPSLKGRVIENPIWFEPNSLDKFDAPIEERRRVINFTGRSSPIKQIGLICKVVPLILDAGWRGEIIGAERSINSVQEGNEAAQYQPKYRHLIQMWAPTLKGLSLRQTGGYLPREVSDPPIFALDRYTYENGMTRLGSSMASWAGYRLTNPKEYGHRMEYTQIEACYLTVPILNKSFATEAYSPEEKLWADYDCFLTSSIDDHEQLAEDLIRLENSPKEWRDRHECAQSIIVDFFDVDTLAPKFMESVLALGKKPLSTAGLDLMHWWTDAKHLDETVLTTPTAILGKKKLVMRGTTQVAYTCKE